jgi:hypothetical protein
MIYKAIITWLIVNEIFVIWRMEVAIRRGALDSAGTEGEVK